MALASLLALCLCSAVVVDASRQRAEDVLATVTDAAAGAVGAAARARPGTVGELQRSLLAETGKTEIALTAFLDIGEDAEGDLEPKAARDQAPPASGAAEKTKKTVSFNPKVTIIGDDGVETTEAEEDTCRPEGIGLRLSCLEMPMWTDVIELMGSNGGPREPYEPYGPCLEANKSTPYLHHNGIRKCCMPSPPTMEMACNLLSAVNWGVQTTKLSEHALAMMMDDDNQGFNAKAGGWIKKYDSLVQFHKQNIRYYKRKWGPVCPDGTFAEVVALDTEKDIQDNAQREQFRALMNGCLNPMSMVKLLTSLMRSK